MTHFLSLSRAIFPPLAMLIALTTAPGAVAQSDTVAVREAPDARVAAMPVALYNAQANLQEATDTAVGKLANEVLQSRLQGLLGSQLAPQQRVTAIASSTRARQVTGGQACNVIVSCSRMVASSLQAPWVVMAKVSKTSNLIWLFTGQLINVRTGKILLDDSTELKGEPGAMVRAGTRIFAERIARTVKQGGLVTNFPTAAATR
ncbi:MAG TPA: DUF2380 domain-containing protein [Gemmatimonadales bacterium]|nr:DUF2380 domain-containing protein [Gemmatimonadales bacterium]